MLEIISDVIPAYAFINVHGITKVMTENQIMQFGEFGYVHVYSILPDRVKLAYGTELGNCSTGCRCVAFTIPTVTGICGDGNVTGDEECEKPGDACYANSGLLSVCTNDCKCPEPWTGLTFCGDNAVQTPNTFGLMEMLAQIQTTIIYPAQ